MDWGVSWEDLEDPITVTLRYLAAGVAAEKVVPYAWKSAEEKREVTTSPAMTEATFCRFHLWADHLGGVEPTKGNKVAEEGGAVWHVESAQKQSRGRRFRLECRRDR
jgi:hypothetical protein